MVPPNSARARETRGAAGSGGFSAARARVGVLALEEVRVAGQVTLGGGEVALTDFDLAADSLELAAQ